MEKDTTLQDHSALLRKLRSRSSISRSTYTPTNAHKVKPIIDKLLDGNTDILVTAEETGYKVNTLHVKLSDGFKFLVDNSTEYGPIYAELRTQVALRKTATGVLIYFKDTIRNQIKAKEMDTFRRENLIIKHEDIKWLEEQQKLVDFEFDTVKDTLSVVR